MTNKGYENLRPGEYKLTLDDQKAGGRASVKARQRKKAMRETLEMLLGMNIKKGRAADIEAIKSIADLKGKNITAEEAICLKAVMDAIKGDSKAREWVRDTSGERPTNDTKLTLQSPILWSGEDELED